MKENETSDGKRSGRMLTGMFTDRGSAESAFNSLQEGKGSAIGGTVGTITGVKAVIGTSLANIIS